MVLAVFVGHPVLSAWGGTPQALTAATGLLLLLTSLQPLVGWPAVAPPSAVPIGTDIVPPFAVGVLVLFSAFFHDLTSQLQMVGVAFTLLLIDLLAMQMIFWAVRSAFALPAG